MALSGRRRAGLAAVVAALVVLGGSAAVLWTNRPWDSGDLSALPSTSDGPSTSAPATGDWADYFTPARVGHTCTLTGDTDTGALTETYTTRRSVTAVTATDAEAVINVAEVRMRYSTQPGSDRQLFPWRDERELTYTVAADGTLHTPALANVVLVNNPYTDDPVVYPTVEDLRAGRGRESVVTLLGSSADDVAEGAPATRLTILVEGVDTSPVRAPAGTFSDVVVVKVTPIDAEQVNVSAEEQAQLDEQEGQLLSLLGETTTWYARGVGPVRSELVIGPQRIVLEANECG